MMKYLLLLTLLVTLTGLSSACSELSKANLENTEIVIDGKTYKVELKEVTPNTTATENEITPEPIEEYTSSIRPPITKFLLKDADGTVYLMDSYTSGSTTKLSEYWVKESDYWVYHKEIKEFPFSIRVESPPEGGEFGVQYPPDNFTVYIETADGSMYVMKQGSKVIPITLDTIRLFKYYVRDKSGGRWYYNEGPKDLPKKDARLL